MTPGEIVVPRELQTPEVMAALDWAAAGMGLTLDRLRVGTRANSINPKTGAPEFDISDLYKKWSVDPPKKLPPIIPTTQLEEIGVHGRHIAPTTPRLPPNHVPLTPGLPTGTGETAGFSAGRLPKDMNYSEELVDFLIQHEKFKPNPYEDPPESGKWSIGYGHQLGKGEYTPGMTWTDAQARDQLNADIANAANGVKSLVTSPLTQAQFNALTSLVYNIGSGGFATSDVLKNLNSGNYLDAATEMLNFDWAGGIIQRGLTDRRRNEANWFMGVNAGALPATPPRGRK